MTILVRSILTRFIGHHAALSVVLVDVWDFKCSYGSSASLPPGGERCPSGLEEAERRYTNTDACTGACEGDRGEAQRPAGTSERVSRGRTSRVVGLYFSFKLLLCLTIGLHVFMWRNECNLNSFGIH